MERIATGENAEMPAAGKRGDSWIVAECAVRLSANVAVALVEAGSFFDARTESLFSGRAFRCGGVDSPAAMPC